MSNIVEVKPDRVTVAEKVSDGNAEFAMGVNGVSPNPDGDIGEIINTVFTSVCDVVSDGGDVHVVCDTLVSRFNESDNRMGVIVTEVVREWFTAGVSHIRNEVERRV